MNVIKMTNEVSSIANSMIRKSPLPHFGLASDERSKFVRVRALDELHTTLKSHILRWCEHEMNMIWHKDERVNEETVFAAVAKKGFEKQPGIILDHEESTMMPGRES